jgi:hypothetical protein
MDWAGVNIALSNIVFIFFSSVITTNSFNSPTQRRQNDVNKCEERSNITWWEQSSALSLDKTPTSSEHAWSYPPATCCMDSLTMDYQ